MSTNIKGIATIELKSDRFTQPADKAKSSIEQLGTRGKQSIEKIATGADRAKQSMSTMASSASTSMSQVGRSATLAGSQVTQSAARGAAAYNQLGVSGQRAGSQISTGMVQAAAATTQMTAATQQASVSMGVMTLGVAALGTSIGTTFTGMSNINKAHLKQNKSIQKVAKVTVGLARANDLLSSTQLAVQRFTISVAKMEEMGLQATDAYTIGKANLTLQLQKLGTAQDDYAVKLKDIQLAEDDALQVADDLQDTYINMTISISNTALMSAFLVKTLMPNLTFALIKVRIGLLLARFQFRDLTRQILFTIFNLNKFRVAMVGATFGLRGLSIGIRAFMLALGPIGIAMIAIGAAFVIWETNAFGVQQAIAELWNWLKKILPVLQVLELLVQSVFPPAEESIEEMGDATEKAGDQLGGLPLTAEQLEAELGTGLVPQLDKLTTGFNSVETGAANAGKAIDEFKKKQESLLQTKAFAELSRQEQNEVLYGRSGIFIRTTRNLVGFRGEPIAVTRPGTEKAIQAAMLRLGITRAAAIEITKTLQFMRSRVLSQVQPIIGGQVQKAIFAFLGTRAGTTQTAGFQIANVGFARGGRDEFGNIIHGRSPPSSMTARIRIQDAQITRLATGGRLLPGMTIGQPGAVVGGFSTRQAARAAGKRARWRQVSIVERLFPGTRFGTGPTVFQTASRIISGINRRFAPIGITFDMIAGGRISLATANRHLEGFNLMIASFASRANLTIGEAQTIYTSSQQGRQDLHNLGAFQERIRLEANTV